MLETQCELTMVQSLLDEEVVGGSIFLPHSNLYAEVLNPGLII
jgi:hypothetical protein